MDGGTSEQVDCLSNADAYMPSADLSTDVAAVLQQCQVIITMSVIMSVVIVKLVYFTSFVVNVVSSQLSALPFVW